MVSPGNINTIGGIADESIFIEEMQQMYENAALRNEYRQRGLDLVRKEEYRWSNIADRFSEILQQTMEGKIAELEEKGTFGKKD